MISEQRKQELHIAAQSHAESTHKELETALVHEGSEATRLEASLVSYKGHDRLVQEKVLGFRKEAIENLIGLVQAPYFVRCDARLIDTGETRSFYFAKHSYTPSDIYSWITPAATMRYETIGHCTFRLPDGTRQEVELLRKDQFMVVRDHVVYMTTEDAEHERTLVYQEYFSRQKRQFALTDIVAQMEKAQDAVIRANPRGSLLITGPAGSGKTTLALHRLAYLAQAPDTMELFPSDRMVIFVQDVSTQIYFSNLLPELGIHNVLITTFDDWAAGLLEVVPNKSGRDLTKDVYAYEKFQFQKNAALNQPAPALRTGEVYKILEKTYTPYLDKVSRRLFEIQKSEQSLDRFDYAVLLRRTAQKHDGRIVKVKYHDVKNAVGHYLSKKRYVPLNYCCIVVDEVQNYLPEQIRLLQKCIDQGTGSMLYVGDLAQQTKLCTLKDWKHVNEEFSDERHVNLTKAYRNTRQILEYVKSLGYKTEVQSERDGETVKVRIMPLFEDRVSELRDTLSKQAGRLVGLLFKDVMTLEKYRGQLSIEFPDVHFMTAAEAQGVEFSVVYLVEMEVDENRMYSPEAALSFEQKRIERDVLYVALTRAMDELFVIGASELKAVFNEVV